MIKDRLVKDCGRQYIYEVSVRTHDNDIKWVDYLMSGIAIRHNETNDWTLYPVGNWIAKRFALVTNKEIVTVDTKQEALDILRKLVALSPIVGFEIMAGNDNDDITRQCIKNEIDVMFTDSEYAQMIYDIHVDDIVTDIKETADEDYNSSDIRLAIQRVILTRMGFNI
jgi:hypothetical protein